MLGPRDPDDYLLPTERRVIRVRRHWISLSKVLLQTIAILIVAFVLSYAVSGAGEGLWLVQTILWYGSLAAVARLAYHSLEWWVERVVVTDKRFMITSGILETKISLMPITKVTDMSYTRPLIGRILGYGTLRVESAGQKQDLENIEHLPRPETVYDAISELIFGEKGQNRAPALAPPRTRGRRGNR
ncbi:MAG TPA: PH domain-containing protein [Pseudonocardiaceae bacterium]|nr:PH domain-containing protein [Pseudonocardiaceae bacterium]